MEIATKKLTTLGHAGDVSTLGIDGLYLYGNSLIGIQNSCGLERILKYELDDRGERVTGLRVLERGNGLYHTPMTGAIVGHELFFVAFGRPPKAASAAGSKAPPQETVIHRLPLGQ